MKSKTTQLIKKIVAINLFLLLALFSKSALAASIIEMNEDKPIKNQEIQSGLVKVLVNYEPSLDNKNLDYKIFYNNVQYIENKTYTQYTGYVDLKDLDKDGNAEVIVSTYSGGAHCCTNFLIYTWQKNRFVKTDLEFMDENGGSFIDLDKDGYYEFTTYDNAFLYTFSSYAGSFPPSLIYTFKAGKMEKVTPKYKKELKATAWKMYKAFLENKKNNSEVNGVLAGYVAQKILLGEYEDAWKFMLANYDKKSDWGLDIYKGENVVGKYPNFPTALRAFLIQQGYLNRNGQPF